MFDLEDASTDGTIDAQEFAIVCSSYGLDTKECEEAFAKMSKVSLTNAGSINKYLAHHHNLYSSRSSATQGAIEVTRDEFAILWREYFSSDEPSAAGNFIFGKTSF